MSSQTSTERVIYQRAGQMIGGHAVGIIVLNVGYPLIPGNVANASTFPFPVRYEVVEGADIPSLLAGDQGLLAPSLEAAQRLVRDGCHAIVGACGYFARFQTAMAAELEVPVFMSSLLQIPFLSMMFDPRRPIGCITATRRSLVNRVLEMAGVRSDINVVVRGMEDHEHFRWAILEEGGELDSDRIEEEVVS